MMTGEQCCEIVCAGPFDHCREGFRGITLPPRRSAELNAEFCYTYSHISWAQPAAAHECRAIRPKHRPVLDSIKTPILDLRYKPLGNGFCCERTAYQFGDLVVTPDCFGQRNIVVSPDTKVSIGVQTGV